MSEDSSSKVMLTPFVVHQKCIYASLIHTDLELTSYFGVNLT